MAIDFNKNYYMKTDKGNYSFLLFYYDGLFSAGGTFFDKSKLYYKGNSLTSLSDVECSTLLRSWYRQDFSPYMGTITEIVENLPTGLTFYANNTGVFANYNNTTNGTSATGELSSAWNTFYVVFIVVDSVGTAQIRGQTIRFNTNNFTFTSIENTADSFGYLVIQQFDWSSFSPVIGSRTLDILDFENSIYWKGVSVIGTDPYAPIGDSGPSGPGDGTFDFTSTDIPIPGLPNIGAMSTGFLNLYHPSAAQLRSLAAYMWSGSFDPANMRKLFADPMDAILGLHIIPTISGHPAASSSSLYVGNVDTGLSMPAVTEQYYSLDCGEVQIPPKWGAYLDYSPYSKLSLYLPYIGVVPISADDCMRGSIRVQYHVDVLSGTCVAFVYCVSNRGADGHTLYTFTGSCNCECPVTEGQYANALMAGMRVVSGIVSGSAGGVAGMVAGGISEAANAAISMVKPDIGRSGGLGGSAGLMGIQYPYLILTVPRMAKPADQNKYIGYPSFVTLTMGDCEGFTRIEVTHLEGIPATQGELEEIVGLLSEGVIF